jgi:hypothetical protein
MAVGFDVNLLIQRFARLRSGMKSVKNIALSMMIGSFVLAGCGAKEVHYFYLPDQAKNSKENKNLDEYVVQEKKQISLKSTLLTEIVNENLNHDRRKEFLASALLYLIKNDPNQGFELKQDYLEQILFINSDKVLVQSGELFDVVTDQSVDAGARYKQFLEQQSIFAQTLDFNLVEVVRFIEKIQFEKKTSGFDQAKTLFDQQIDQWSHQISEKIFILAQENRALRESIDLVVTDVKNGLSQIPRIDSGFSVIAKSLPVKNEPQKIIKKFLLESTQAPVLSSDFLESVKKSVSAEVENASIVARKLSGLSKSYQAASVTLGNAENTLHYSAKVLETIIGKNKTVDHLVAVGTTAIKIAKITNSVDFKKIGMNLATGNVLGAVSDLVGSLFGMGGQSDPQVMEMLKGIKQDIADLRKHMDQRFDQVLGKLDEQLILLKQNQAALIDIQQSLVEISQNLSQITQKIDQGFDSLFENDFKFQYTTCFKSSLPLEHDLHHLRDCADYFFSYAVNTSYLPQQTGVMSIGSEVPFGEIDSRLSENGVLNKFGFLNSAIGSVFFGNHSSQSPMDGIGLVDVNISDYVIGSESFLALLNSHIGQFKITGNLVQNISKLELKGIQIRNSMMLLSNRDFLNKLLNNYFDSALKLSVSKNFKYDLFKLNVKYKLLTNVFRVVDPKNIYRLPHYEHYFIPNQNSNVHVNLIELSLDGKGEAVNLSKVDEINRRLDQEKVDLQHYLKDRFDGSNESGKVATLIDPVLYKIKKLKAGLGI